MALTGDALLDIPLYWTPTTFSFSFWIKPTKLYNYGQVTGSSAGWGAFLFTGTVGGGVYVGTDQGHWLDLSTARVLEPGVWQHFVFTFNNGEGVLYKNGKVLGRRTDMRAPTAWKGIELGTPTDAVYDELRVYNRAVSAQEAGVLAGHYEAELPAPQVQLTQATIGSSNGVTYAQNLTSVGARVSFSVAVATAGMYRLTTRYASALDYVRTLSVYVNTLDAAQAQFPTTGSWASWSTQSVVVPLRSGCNTIAYAYDADDSGGLNLDYLDVKLDVSAGYTAGSALASALPAEISVDKFTGMASFNALLHTVTIPGVSLPIALHYAATGLRVDDRGGEVGANWSLQAAPSLHRQVRDLPDDITVESGLEKRYGWLRYPAGSPTPADRIRAVPDAAATFNATTCSANEQTALLQLAGFGSLYHNQGASYTLFDTEPDVFTYAIPGYTGKFMFDETGAVRMLPYAPLQITPVFSAGGNSYLPSTCPVTVPAGELAGFTIKTPEGTLYTFNDLERVSQQTQTTASNGVTKYLLRHYYAFNISQYTSGPNPPSSPSNIDYTTGWLATQITTPAALTSPAAKAANSIQFEYACSPFLPVPDSHSNLFLLGNATITPTNDQALVTRVLLSPQLAAIRTATTTVAFARAAEEDTYHITAITVTSPLQQNVLLKSYAFTYAGIGRYLLKVALNRATSTLPLYAFTYAADDGGDPPASAKIQTGLSINKDYWGFANGNRTVTGIPQLYVYPQLLGGTSLRPAAPYRLYPVPAYQSGGTVLSGADRRPASRLNTATAGTLTRITFATGGQVGLEYEQHQFYDPVAQQSLPAGGLRIRTIRVQDPVTQVETRRDYAYQEINGTSAAASSGVLFHLPRFAFPMALANSAAAWADVTVRTTEELAADPFENRHIGYRQVTELLAGKGQVTTVFSVPGGADDASSDYNADSKLPKWQRPVLGLARQPSSGSCPAVAPLQATGELYPFAPAPNYDFARGLPLAVQYRAEPSSGTAPGLLVKQEAYAYQYTSVRPGLGAVTGLRYEQLANPSTALYAYAKYSLLTDFFYALRQQITQVPSAGGTTNQTTVDYRYNSQGWLATKLTLGSDNTLSRVRYKYLSDYALPASGAAGALQAMSTRVKTEGVSADAVEVISEIRPAGSTGRVAYAGATLQTFTTSTVADAANTSVTTPTYPYQLRRWLPAQPVASYDSVRVVNNDLYIPAAMREVSTVLEVNASLTPLSARAQTGRQLSGVLLGYGGTAPVLQAVNAKASELVFSDFEASGSLNGFTVQAASNPTSIAEAAARTGKAGLLFGAGSSLTATLPASATAQYRLVYWAQGAATTCTIALNTGTTTVFTQTVTHEGAGKWKRYEVLLPNRTGYQLSLTASGPLQLDDVLLLPADASAASTTYSLEVGKTSETDARGRTTYYEYGPAGDLALVRDPNRAIVHQYQKVLPGQELTAGIAFTTSGTGRENEPLTFSATSGLKGDLQYRWEFGDGTSATGATATHTYPTLGYNQGYAVRLYVTSQGIEYLYTQNVGITMQPLRLTCCTAGVIAVDDCYKSNNTQVDTSCNANAPNPGSSATFRVTPSLAGNYSYRWQQYNPLNSVSDWNDIAGNANDPSSLTVGKSSTTWYRCIVTRAANGPNPAQDVQSDNFQINHYKSNIDCTP